VVILSEVKYLEGKAATLCEHADT